MEIERFPLYIGLKGRAVPKDRILTIPKGGSETIMVLNTSDDPQFFTALIHSASFDIEGAKFGRWPRSQYSAQLKEGESISLTIRDTGVTATEQQVLDAAKHGFSEGRLVVHAGRRCEDKTENGVIFKDVCFATPGFFVQKPTSFELDIQMKDPTPNHLEAKKKWNENWRDENGCTPGLTVVMIPRLEKISIAAGGKSTLKFLNPSPHEDQRLAVSLESFQFEITGATGGKYPKLQLCLSLKPGQEVQVVIRDKGVRVDEKHIEENVFSDFIEGRLTIESGNCDHGRKDMSRNVEYACPCYYNPNMEDDFKLFVNRVYLESSSSQYETLKKMTREKIAKKEEKEKKAEKKRKEEKKARGGGGGKEQKKLM